MTMFKVYLTQNKTKWIVACHDPGKLEKNVTQNDNVQGIFNPE